jgi:hypothetical protein
MGVLQLYWVLWAWAGLTYNVGALGSGDHLKSTTGGISSDATVYFSHVLKCVRLVANFPNNYGLVAKIIIVT